MSVTAICSQVKKQANHVLKAKVTRFFKCQKGQYGEGDEFAGITNPIARSIAKQNQNLPILQIPKLLQSKIHEERFIGLVIMVHKFKKKDQRQTIYQMYMDNLQAVNNWDLVDLSAPHIVGEYLLEPEKDRSVLYKLVKSPVLWERRISIISTMTFIKKGQIQDCLKISKILLPDKHDLIHKAVGWMLREVGKKSLGSLETFLQENYERIPRTALRYSIEKFPEAKRKAYLKGEF